MKSVTAHMCDRVLFSYMSDHACVQGVSEVSDGAVCVFLEGHQIPLIVQKSDGGFGYASTDMAAIKHRIFTEKADWIVYVTDVG